MFHGLQSHVTPVLVCVSEISKFFTLLSHVTPVLVCVSEIFKRFTAPVTRETCFSMCQ